MVIRNEIDPIDFEAWCGGQDTIEKIKEHGLVDEFNNFCELYFPEGCTENEFNDLLRFEDEFIFENIGLREDDEDEDVEDDEE